MIDRLPHSVLMVVVGRYLMRMLHVRDLTRLYAALPPRSRSWMNDLQTEMRELVRRRYDTPEKVREKFFPLAAPFEPRDDLRFDVEDLSRLCHELCHLETSEPWLLQPAWAEDPERSGYPCHHLAAEPHRQVTRSSIFSDPFHPYVERVVSAACVSELNEEICPSLRGSLVFALGSGLVQFVRHCALTDDFYPIVTVPVRWTVDAMASSRTSSLLVCHLHEDDRVAAIDLRDGRDVRFMLLPLVARSHQVHSGIFLSGSGREFAMLSEYSRDVTAFSPVLVPATEEEDPGEGPSSGPSNERYLLRETTLGSPDLETVMEWSVSLRFHGSDGRDVVSHARWCDPTASCGGRRHSLTLHSVERFSMQRLSSGRGLRLSLPEGVTILGLAGSPDGQSLFLVVVSVLEPDALSDRHGTIPLEELPEDYDLYDPLFQGRCGQRPLEERPRSLAVYEIFTHSRPPTLDSETGALSDAAYASVSISATLRFLSASDEIFDRPHEKRADWGLLCRRERADALVQATDRYVHLFVGRELVFSFLRALKPRSKCRMLKLTRAYRTARFSEDDRFLVVLPERQRTGRPVSVLSSCRCVGPSEAEKERLFDLADSPRALFKERRTGRFVEIFGAPTKPGLTRLMSRRPPAPGDDSNLMLGL